jgi:hypothetical protein
MRSRLGDIEPPPNAEARVLWSRNLAGHLVEGIALEEGSGITLPMLVLKPAGAAAPLPVVIALAQGGKERFLAERGAEIAELLKAGVAVCLPDVRGAGETAWSPERGPANMILAVVEQMLGGTMTGAQLKDARTVFRYVAGRQDFHPKRIALWGDSFAPMNPRQGWMERSLSQPGFETIHQAEPLGAALALLGALYEDGVHAVVARRGLASFASVLEDRFCYVPEDVIVPGILEAGDLADLIASLVPRAVLVEGSVDGKNRLVPEQDLRTRLAAAVAAYRGAPQQFVLRESSARPGVAAWLVEHCRAGN